MLGWGNLDRCTDADALLYAGGSGRSPDVGRRFHKIFFSPSSAHFTLADTSSIEQYRPEAKVEPIRTDPVDYARMILVGYIAGTLCSSAANASRNGYLPFGAGDTSGSAVGCMRDGLTAGDAEPLRDLGLALVCVILAVVFLLISAEHR